MLSQEGEISKTLLDPEKFSSLTSHYNHFNFVRVVQIGHILFQLVVFLYKKYFNVKKSGNWKELLTQTSVDSLANLANVKTCIITTLIILLLIIAKTFFAFLGSQGFFWSTSVAVLLLIFHFPFWGNIILR